MKKGSLSQIDVFAIVLGSIIGWGSFMLPGTKFLIESGVINTAIGLFLGAFGIIIIEKSYRVMLSRLKSDGGEFTYTYENMGRTHGFIVGWALLLAYLTMIPLNSTAFPLVIKKLFGNVLEFGYLYTIAGYRVYLGEILTSSAIVLTFAYINISGIDETSKVQNIIIMALVTLIAIVFTGMLLKSDRDKFVANYVSNYKFDLGQIARILAISPFIFVGFDTIPQVSQEFNFSPKKASKIAVVSLLLSSLMYNLLNISTGLAYSAEEAISLDWALGTGVLENLGKFGFILLVIALSAAVTSGINGFMLSTSKLMGAIGEHKMLPKKFASRNSNNVFHNTIKFATAISLIAPWFGREVIIWIVDMASVGAAVAYLYVCLISYDLVEGTKNKIYSILGVIISASFILLLLVPSSPAALGKESLIALVAWILLGGIFYFSLVARPVLE